MNAINTIAQIAQVAKRGRPANTIVAGICAQVVAETTTYTYVADLVRAVQAVMQQQNLSASVPTITKYIKAAAIAATHLKMVAPAQKPKTADQIKAESIVNLQVHNVVRSGINNIGEVAFELSLKMAAQGIARSKGQVWAMLRTKEKDIANRIANKITSKGKLPKELGLTRKKAGRKSKA